MNRSLAFDFYPSYFSEFALNFFKICPNLIFSILSFQNEIFVYSTPANFPCLISILKKHFNIYMPIDLTVADYPQRFLRFSLLAFFRPYLPFNRTVLPFDVTLTICTVVSESKPIMSIATIYPSMVWPEREIWDLFGVFFANHADLRRLLSDYGFQGHSFRKDFPLSGFSEVRYDDSLQRVVCEPLELTQEYRNFDFLSPWVPVL